MNRSFSLVLTIAMFGGCSYFGGDSTAVVVPAPTAPEGVPATEYTTLSDTNYDGVTDSAVLWYYGSDNNGAKTTTLYKWVLGGVGKAKDGGWLVRTDEGHVDQFVSLSCLKPVHGEQAATDTCPAVTCDFRDGDFAPCDQAPAAPVVASTVPTLQAPSGAALWHMQTGTDLKVDALGKKVDALAERIDKLVPPAPAAPATPGS